MFEAPLIGSGEGQAQPQVRAHLRWKGRNKLLSVVTAPLCGSVMVVGRSTGFVEPPLAVTTAAATAASSATDGAVAAAGPTVIPVERNLVAIGLNMPATNSVTTATSVSLSFTAALRLGKTPIGSQTPFNEITWSRVGSATTIAAAAIGPSTITVALAGAAAGKARGRLAAVLLAFMAGTVLRSASVEWRKLLPVCGGGARFRTEPCPPLVCRRRPSLASPRSLPALRLRLEIRSREGSATATTTAAAAAATAIADIAAGKSSITIACRSNKRTTASATTTARVPRRIPPVRVRGAGPAAGGPGPPKGSGWRLRQRILRSAAADDVDDVGDVFVVRAQLEKKLGRSHHGALLRPLRLLLLLLLP